MGFLDSGLSVTNVALPGRGILVDNLTEYVGQLVDTAHVPLIEPMLGCLGQTMGCPQREVTAFCILQTDNASSLVERWFMSTGP